MRSPHGSRPRTTTAPREPAASMGAGEQSGPRLPSAVQSAWGCGGSGRISRAQPPPVRRRVLARPAAVGRVVVVGTPVLVHHVLTGSCDRFRGRAATAWLLPFLGARSPLLLDGEAHRRRLLRAFSAHGAAERLVDRRPDRPAWIPSAVGRDAVSARRSPGGTAGAHPRRTRALPPSSGPGSTRARPPVRNHARPTTRRPDRSPRASHPVTRHSTVAHPHDTRLQQSHRNR